jgi:putative two-component system response regulator
VLDCAALAERTQTPRALIASAMTRATYELAMGQTDIALTRLEKALAQAREVPAALRDTLTSMVRAEEAAGNVERALVRLRELSDHIYRLAIERARQHVEFAALAEMAGSPLEQEQRQARARLASKTAPPDVPPAWAALERLAVGAAMRWDPTGWHGKRVGALAKALALALGCEPLNALEIGLAAELHDIGFLSVPEGILAKKEPLNDAERAIVRRHVDAGAEMLGDDRHPRVFLAREIARYHHAHWNGEGYPERVAGKRIPFAARVCAIADAYDTMVCGLEGRAPRTMHDALEELGRESGRQFDPEMVACFDELIRTETEDLGMDLQSNAGMEGFQSLVGALREDRGFV